MSNTLSLIFVMTVWTTGAVATYLTVKWLNRVFAIVDTQFGSPELCALLWPGVAVIFLIAFVLSMLLRLIVLFIKWRFPEHYDKTTNPTKPTPQAERVADKAP